jgi:hypothetical protein
MSYPCISKTNLNRIPERGFFVSTIFKMIVVDSSLEVRIKREDEETRGIPCKLTMLGKGKGFSYNASFRIKDLRVL